MTLFKYVILLCSIISFSCSKAPTRLTQTEKESITLEIREMFLNYHKAIKTGGLEAEFDYLDDSSDFYWVPPGYKSSLDIDSVKTILTHNAKSIDQIEFTFETLEIFPLRKTIANYTGIVKGKMTDTARVTSTFRIIESGTLVKRPDGWKLLSGQSRNLK